LLDKFVWYGCLVYVSHDDLVWVFYQLYLMFVCTVL
jgi:hypothetical protein